MIRNILVAFLLITSISLVAQRTSSSPYSFFGIGDEFNSLTVEQSSMGGIGVAFNHYKYLNFTNPAAYAHLRYTTYAFGAVNSDLTIKNGNVEQTSNSTSLSYVALAFPIGEKAGFSFGLQPISSVGYSISNTEFDASGVATEINILSGTGGINRVYGSFGMKLFKNVSVGIEADYSFGNVEHNIVNQRANVSLATKNNETLIVRGGSVTLGTQYQKVLKNDLVVNAGATLKLGNELDVTGNDYLYTLTFSNTGGETARDTLSDSSVAGKYNLPLKTIFGGGIGKFDKWYVGAEFETQDAFQTTNLNNISNATFKYGESNRFSLGGFYIPKINSISSYWQRVTYRAGLRLEKTGLLIDSSGNSSNFTSVNDFGISFGLGLPLKQLSNINMGFEFGKRGSTENNLIQENYFNFRLSLSLTDTGWFIKRKID
ncbi:MAG: hypothetical protein AB8B78_05570 [Polaribacter sp.]